MKKIKINFKLVFSALIALFFISYFCYYAIFGTKGILNYLELRAVLQKKIVAKNKLDAKLKDKENLVNSLQSDSLDIDLLDIKAREKSGHAKENEIIIYYDNE